MSLAGLSLSTTDVFYSLLASGFVSFNNAFFNLSVSQHLSSYYFQ